VVQRFDSLLTIGTPQALRAAEGLTTGAARRLFPLLAETQGRLNDVIDTGRTRDTILEEARNADRAALKVRADIVFTRPFLGMKTLTSVQAIHLVRTGDAWKIEDFEELTEASAPIALRSGAVASRADTARGALLPLSPRAPPQNLHARVTRLLLRVSRRDGQTLLPVPVAPGQQIWESGRAAASSSLELATARVSPRDTLRTGRPAPARDSLVPYLASTRELDLTDKMLRTRAAKLAQGSPSDVETTRRVWEFVMTSFDYKLGATLFATSREALRDMKGDCSEAAVLTAALLRAAGIPSRVMMGYASLGQGVWIGHAWAEAWLGGERGEWVGVDAALREFPAGPHRVALAALSGEEDMKAAATNLMLSTLNNLDIEIVSARAGDTVLPLIEHPAAAAQARRFWDQIMDGLGRMDLIR